MRFINAIIYREDCKFHKGSFSVDKGLFTDEIKDDEIIDLEGRYVIPGLVDIHLHGNSGVDFSEADYEGLKRIANYLAKQGITSFSPASMTLDEVLLKNAYKNAVRLRDERPANSSRIRGITMEGPFLSLEKRGAHKKEHLKLPDLEMYLRLQEYAEGMIGLVCVAPELEGCLEFIRKVSKECTVSIAHTTASYEVAKKAIRAGATHITHLFNAMPPFHH
ncbi:MAG: amidohydrolase family protein [Clostridiales bacterium]|nr:amidohydrolase family protein [Clostridiales bacterium]